MKMNKQRAILIAVLAFFAGAAVTGGIAFAMTCGIGNYSLVKRGEYKAMSEFYNEYRDLASVDSAIDTYYYQDTSDIDRSDAVCKSLVDSLGDKYSAYMTKEEYENFEATTTGSYSGVGIVFSADEEGDFVVIGIYDDSPAASSDIEPGDLILKVDGKSYDDQDVLAANIRGEAGTEVEILYEHEGKKHTVKLVREEIKIESVSSKKLEDGTGYIAISEFLTETSEDFDKALRKLQDKGCDKLIIDLRNNGGGLVNEAVEIADEFIDSGYITCTIDKGGNRDEYKADASKEDMDVVVLVNENTASSSEILAGALKDNGYQLVGQKTFGKGIIQTTMPLEDGSALKLTIAQYLTPSGKEVHKKGIKPNYEVEDPEEDEPDEQLQKAQNLLK